MNEPETLQPDNNGEDKEAPINPSNPETLIISREEFDELMNDPYKRLVVFNNLDKYAELNHHQHHHAKPDRYRLPRHTKIQTVNQRKKYRYG